MATDLRLYDELVITVGGIDVTDYLYPTGQGEEVDLITISFITDLEAGISRKECTFVLGGDDPITPLDPQASNTVFTRGRTVIISYRGSTVDTLFIEQASFNIDTRLLTVRAFCRLSKASDFTLPVDATGYTVENPLTAGQVISNLLTRAGAGSLASTTGLGDTLQQKIDDVKSGFVSTAGQIARARRVNLYATPSGAVTVRTVASAITGGNTIDVLSDYVEWSRDDNNNGDLFGRAVARSTIAWIDDGTSSTPYTVNEIIEPIGAVVPLRDDRYVLVTEEDYQDQLDNLEAGDMLALPGTIKVLSEEDGKILGTINPDRLITTAYSITEGQWSDNRLEYYEQVRSAQNVFRVTSEYKTVFNIGSNPVWAEEEARLVESGCSIVVKKYDPDKRWLDEEASYFADVLYAYGRFDVPAEEGDDREIFLGLIRRLSNSQWRVGEASDIGNPHNQMISSASNYINNGGSPGSLASPFTITQLPNITTHQFGDLYAIRKSITKYIYTDGLLAYKSTITQNAPSISSLDFVGGLTINQTDEFWTDIQDNLVQKTVIDYRDGRLIRRDSTTLVGSRPAPEFAPDKIIEASQEEEVEVRFSWNNSSYPEKSFSFEYFPFLDPVPGKITKTYRIIDRGDFNRNLTSTGQGQDREEKFDLRLTRNRLRSTLRTYAELAWCGNWGRQAVVGWDDRPDWIPLAPITVNGVNFMAINQIIHFRPTNVEVELDLIPTWPPVYTRFEYGSVFGEAIPVDEADLYVCELVFESEDFPLLQLDSEIVEVTAGSTSKSFIGIDGSSTAGSTLGLALSSNLSISGSVSESSFRFSNIGTLFSSGSTSQPFAEITGSSAGGTTSGAAVLLNASATGSASGFTLTFIFESSTGSTSEATVSFDVPADDLDPLQAQVVELGYQAEILYQVFD